MRARFFAALAVVALAVLLVDCADAPAAPAPTPATASGRWWPPRTYSADPAVHGRVDAEDAIARGRPLRLVHGEADDQRIDPATGLPVSGFGCCYEDANAKYLDAYNAVVDAALAAGRLREFDFRPRLLSEDAARALLETSGRPLAPGDPRIAAPGGAHRIVLVGGTDDTNECYLYTERADGTGRWALRQSFGALRVAFTEDGLSLLASGGNRPGIEVFDLPHAVSIQVVPEAPSPTK